MRTVFCWLINDYIDWHLEMRSNSWLNSVVLSAWRFDRTKNCLHNSINQFCVLGISNSSHKCSCVDSVCIVEGRTLAWLSLRNWDLPGKTVQVALVLDGVLWLPVPLTSPSSLMAWDWHHPTRQLQAKHQDGLEWTVTGAWMIKQDRVIRWLPTFPNSTEPLN